MALTNKLMAIADSIREKTGKTDVLTLDQMPLEIAGIQTGVELNFKVVGGTTEPTNPSENTIWVNTSTTITGWTFSATEPEAPANGETPVWISISTVSPVDFNALGNNGIQVYPLGVKQYISGVWVDKEAKSYQDGTWADWILYLYDSGVLNDIYTNGTGMLISEKRATSTNNNKRANPSVTYSSNSITIVPGNSNYHDGGIVYFPKKIDLTGYNSIVFEGSVTVGDKTLVSLCVWSQLCTYIDKDVIASLATAGTLDISSLSGEHYIGFRIYGVGSEIVVNSLGIK